MIRENSMRPFQPGDVFLGCTLLNDPTDDHAGLGRILQYDKNFNIRGVLWTQGTTHFVGGLAFDRNGLLWAFDGQTVVHVDPKTGRQLPLATSFLPRSYRSASFARDGSIYLGEHMKGKEPPPGIEKMTTMTFRRIAGEGVLGYGCIYKYDSDWRLVKVFEPETAPEFTGFKGVTHSTLHPSEKFIAYATETGKRLMRYDVVDDRQMPDLLTLPGELRDRNYVVAVRYLPDGRLIVARGDWLDVLDEEGRSLRTYKLPEFGWAEIGLCADGKHIFVSNMFTGIMIKVNLDSGDIVGWIVTGMVAPRRSLAGVAEYAG